MKKIWILILLFIVTGGCFMQVAIKLGSRNLANLYKEHTDSQVVHIALDRTYSGKQVLKHFAILNFPGVPDFRDTNLLRYFCARDSAGKSPWEAFYNWDDFVNGLVDKRNWKIDLTQLKNDGRITQAKLNALYDPDRIVQPINIDVSLDQIIKPEDHTRADNAKLMSTGTVYQDKWRVGSGLDYDTYIVAEADTGSPLTGDLTFEGNDEETVMDAQITWNPDTATFLLKLCPENGDKHNGTYSGARLKYGASNDRMSVNCKNMEISGLALDVDGTGNFGVSMTTTFISGSNLALKDLLIKGNGGDSKGLNLRKGIQDIQCFNNIIFGLTDNNGLEVNGDNQVGTWKVANNTISKCNIGIQLPSQQATKTINIYKNLMQNNTTDYNDASSRADDTDRNITEDLTSPDGGSYQGITITTFTDEGNDNYIIASADPTLADGVPVSGIPLDILGNIRDLSNAYIGSSEFVEMAVGKKIYPHWIY